MTTTETNRLCNPPHVGTFIRQEITEPLDLSVTQAANVLGVSRPALSALLNGRAQLSAEMALRIEKAFGIKMDTLMRMQNSYDIAQARAQEHSIQVQTFKPNSIETSATAPA